MSRYFYYWFLLGMFINTIFFVPRLLLSERFEGSITAIMIASVLGSTLAVLFVRAMNRFPGQSITEMFMRTMPSFVRFPVLFFLGIMWVISGSVILVSFSTITNRLLNPETNPTLLLFCYCGIGAWASGFRPKAVLNVSEIVLTLNIPIVIFLMYKTLNHPLFQWDSVKVLTDYSLRLPTWTAVSAASYPFAGYINLAVYNRVFKELKVRHIWLIPALGCLVLLNSFIVPVGLMGVQAVGDYLYTWISTVDTVRFKFGFIERASYLFLFIYIGFSLLFVTVTWNIGSMLIADNFKKKTFTVKSSKIPLRWIVCFCFGAATFVFGMVTDDKSLIGFVKRWMNVRLAMEMLLVSVVVWLAWRKKRRA